MSKNIKELREELQKQTQETLKLQEVATKLSLESIARREGSSITGTATGLTSNSTTASISNKHSVVLESTSCAIPGSSGGSPSKVMSSRYEVDPESPRKSSTYTGKEQIETILEEYSQQVRDLQRKLSETTEQNEHQKFTLRQSIIELQTSLRDVMKEKDSINELRRKESQSQEDANSKMRATIGELQTASILQEEMLKEANSQSEHLKKMVQGQEEVFEELRNILLKYEESSNRKVFEYESINNLHICNLPSAFAKVLRELETEVSRLKTRLAPLEEQIEMTKKESQSKTEVLLQQHQETIERLISEHEQELEVLSQAANASRSHASNIQSQMEIIQEQARNQNSLYMRQIGQLESTVSQLRSELRESRRLSQDKIEELEKQLHLVHSEMAAAQNERDQYSQESGNLDDQVQQLMVEMHKKEMELNLEREQNKRLWDRDTGSSITIDHLRRELDTKNMELQRMDSIIKSMQMECQGQMERQMSAIREKNECLERIASIVSQHESTKEMLHKVVEELTEKKLSFESVERQVVDLTSSLQEKEKVIESTNEEIQKLRGRVDSKLQELQQLKSESDHLRGKQSECESVKIQLSEKEKLIEILRKQIENMTQIVGQHSRSAGAMELEKSQLLKEVNEKKLELQEFKILQDRKDSQIRELESSLSDMELEKVKLMKTCSERLRMLKEMKQEREELVNEIKTSRIELTGLAEEAEVRKSEYREKNEEMEATVNKLKMQLKSAQIELEQTRATLKTMEGSDGHAMKVAMGMQKQITAKRGQIDALQSKIKFLEEAMTNATKEKHYLKEERNRLSQDLTCVAALNNKLSGELEILKSQDKRLKDKLITMEAALDKASVQFAECQCVMQRQEQEVMRFKLQHTLDIKELQGPGYTLGSSLMKQRHSTLPHPQPSSVPSSQTFAGHLSLMPSKLCSTKEDPLRDLKQLLQDLRCTIDEIPSSILPRIESDSGSESLERPSSILEAAVKDLSSEITLGQDAFSRDALTLHTADLEDQDTTSPCTSSASQAIFSSTPRYTFSKKLSSDEKYKDRSPVHSLLTAPLDDLKAAPMPSLERRSNLKKSNSPEATVSASCRSVSFRTASSIQMGEAGGQTCRKLQNKMESLQNIVETLQLKNQAMSTMIRCQEQKIDQAKEKEEAVQMNMGMAFHHSRGL